jgi:Fic family protein
MFISIRTGLLNYEKLPRTGARGTVSTWQGEAPSRATVYARLEAAVEELRSRLGGLPSPKESESIWSDIWYQEAHHSTALEGNTLALRQVEQLLAQGRAVGAKPLREYNEVKGYANAAEWVYGQALEPDEWSDGALISLNELRRIHHTAMTPVWEVAPHPEAGPEDGPGHFRRHDLHAFAQGMKPPSWPDLPELLRDWVDEVAATGEAVRAAADLPAPLPEELARLHNRFERVHPFLDGNGRTGRLTLNLMLVRLGYPPVVIFKRQRDAYLAALQKADGGDFGRSAS